MVSMEPARLGDATMSLEFADPRFDESGFSHLEARLLGTRLDARLGFYAHDAAELVQYFRSLDDDWRGWSGERRFESVEGDVVLSARHVRRIELTVSLTAEADRDVSTSVGWTCTAVVSVEPGEGLSRFVRALDVLVSPGIAGESPEHPGATIHVVRR